MKYLTMNGKNMKEEMKKYLTRETYIQEHLKTGSLSEYLHKNKSPQFICALQEGDEPIIKKLLNKEGMTYEDLIKENKDTYGASVIHNDIHSKLKGELYKADDVDSIFNSFRKSPIEEVLSYAERSPETHQKYVATLEEYFSKNSGHMANSVFQNTALKVELSQSTHLFKMIRNEVDAIKNPNYQVIDKFMEDRLQDGELRHGCHNEFVPSSERSLVAKEFRESYEKVALNQKLEEKLVKEQPAIKKTIRQREQEEGFTIKI